ncbi:MAG: penicillin-binding protein 1C [Prevotellaceae bacterium]|jgi:penicillin-binding protein 1C|nr:penicillin-binding protein 1C [Prevotellaceae bacterium]
MISFATYRHPDMRTALNYIAFALYIPVTAFFCCTGFSGSEPCSVVIEDSSGELLGARIAADGQWRFPAKEILPEQYVQALIAFEDKRFYSHQGIDPLAVARALAHNIRQGKTVEGGSTITMQAVRMMRKGKKRTLKEKLIETLLAIRLEASMSKREILVLYAARAPFGGNVAGIEAAAWRYFGRNAADMSWAEAATLAVLPNSPALIHPGRNRNALKAKRDTLLNNMMRLRIIDENNCILAKIEPLPENPLPLPRLAPHLLDRIAAKHPGMRISTTLSATLQQSVNSVVDNHISAFKANRVNNAAVIVAEIESGNVIAYTGNVIAGNRRHGADVDIITAPRSTGSILKPFLYAAMLDEGEILPHTLIPDIPFHVAGFSPHNYNRSFDGAVPAHDALTRSLNVPSVRMLADYNVEKFHLLLKDLGMTTLNRPAMHYGLSIILGGAEGTLWDIAGMYADMARTVNRFGGNSGRYNIFDRKKLNCFKDSPDNEPRPPRFAAPVISAAAIYQTLETLSELNRPEEESSWMMFSSGRKIAWKTGTSYGNRDAWAVGVTPDYVVGVWVGNASGEGRPRLTGVGYAAPLMFDIFNLLPRSKAWFRPPYDEMTLIATCRQSGHRAGEYCEQVDSIPVTHAGLQSGACPYHRLIHLDRDEKYRVNSSCYPAHAIVHRKWFVLPPAQEWYYRRHHADYRPLPPTDPRCATDESSPMQMIYPTYGISVVVTRQLDGEKGKIVMQAAHNRAKSTIFWHIDDQYTGETHDNHQMPYLPSAGNHTITLIDDEGYSLTMPFVVK